MGTPAAASTEEVRTSESLEPSVTTNPPTLSMAPTPFGAPLTGSQDDLPPGTAGRAAGLGL